MSICILIAVNNYIKIYKFGFVVGTKISEILLIMVRVSPLVLRHQ